MCFLLIFVKFWIHVCNSRICSVEKWRGPLFTICDENISPIQKPSFKNYFDCPVQKKGPWPRIKSKNPNATKIAPKIIISWINCVSAAHTARRPRHSFQSKYLEWQMAVHLYTLNIIIFSLHVHIKHHVFCIVYL